MHYECVLLKTLGVDIFKKIFNVFGKHCLDSNEKEDFSYTEGTVTAMIGWVLFSIYSMPDLEMRDS